MYYFPNKFTFKLLLNHFSEINDTTSSRLLQGFFQGEILNKGSIFRSLFNVSKDRRPVNHRPQNRILIYKRYNKIVSKLHFVTEPGSVGIKLKIFAYYGVFSVVQIETWNTIVLCSYSRSLYPVRHTGYLRRIMENHW